MQGIIKLCNSCKNNSKLLKLDISKNRIHDNPVKVPIKLDSDIESPLPSREGKRKPVVKKEELFESISATDVISEMLVENYVMKELYLGWNKIKQRGGKAIFTGLL